MSNLESFLTGDLQSVGSGSKFSTIRGIKSKPRPQAKLQRNIQTTIEPEQPLDPEDPNAGLDNEAQAEQAGTNDLPEGDVLPDIDPVNPNALQPGEGGVVQPESGTTTQQQDPTIAQPGQTTAEGTGGGGGDGGDEPAGTAPAGTDPQEEARLDKLKKGSIADTSNTTKLSDEQRQTLLQKDVLDVLLRTEAGRILLGDRRQEEARAREIQSALSREPTKNQVRIQEIQFETKQLQEAAFPQLQALRVMRESRQVGQANTSNIDAL